MIEDEIAARLLLLTMPGMGPARLRWITSTMSGVTAVRSLRREEFLATQESPPSGVNADLVASWASHARSVDGSELLDQHRVAGVSVVAPGDPSWPFEDDPEPPALLFVRGNQRLLMEGARVGIVGTRRCTSVGRRVARDMGAELAAAGVTVVSGLALGIDGAAHHGAMLRPGGGAMRPGGDAMRAGSDGRPVIGVVATGLDVPYPKKHAPLWDEVGQRGVLVSEAPLGTHPQKWRFPARNRILAALSDVVVVVESHSKGGALSTVEEAISRSIDVVAVPGSVLSAASEGTNALLFDGCAPVRGALDVLELLGLDKHSPQLSLFETPNSGQPKDPVQRQILSEVTAQGLHLDALIAVTGCPFAEVVGAVQALESVGLVRLDGSTVIVNSEEVTVRSR